MMEMMGGQNYDNYSCLAISYFNNFSNTYNNNSTYNNAVIYRW